MYEYDKKFYEYISKGATDSAQELLPMLLESFKIDSVLDVGCGAGAWLKVWSEHGVKIKGIDGDYVDRSNLLINADSFMPKDLSKGFDLGETFSLVQSLEVAEHLPESSAQKFVDCLCAHADVVMFSAAPPGQGGDNHVNEKPYDYWRLHFAKNNFVAVDMLRPRIIDNQKVEPWYRYNTIIYVDEKVFDSLPEKIRACKVEGKIRDISPLVYKARKVFIRALPLFLATKIAKVKEHLVIARQRKSNS